MYGRRRGGRLPCADIEDGAAGNPLGFLLGYAEHAQEGFGELVDGGLVDLFRTLLVHPQQPE